MAQHRRADAEITAENLDRLPIFPLPRVVLFPGVVVPLTCSSRAIERSPSAAYTEIA